MNDKENESQTVLNKLSLINSIEESRPTTTLSIGKTTVSAINNDINKINQTRSPSTSRQVYKNLTLISFAFLMLFTGHTGIVSLQSTLNAKGNVGVNTLIVMNSFVLVRMSMLIKSSKKRFLLVWFTFSS